MAHHLHALHQGQPHRLVPREADHAGRRVGRGLQQRHHRLHAHLAALSGEGVHRIQAGAHLPWDARALSFQRPPPRTHQKLLKYVGPSFSTPPRSTATLRPPPAPRPRPRPALPGGWPCTPGSQQQDQGWTWVSGVLPTVPSFSFGAPLSQLSCCVCRCGLMAGAGYNR